MKEGVRSKFSACASMGYDTRLAENQTRPRPLSATCHPPLAMLLQDPPPTQADLHFELFGFPVRVHPYFWLIALLLGLNGSSTPPEATGDLGRRAVCFHSGA